LGQAPGGIAWLAQVSEQAGVNVEPASRYGDELIEWLHSVTGQLADVDFVFELLLPADDESLVERMEEFAAWCAAFSEGVAIALAAVPSGTELSDDTKDLFGDIVAISQLDPDSAEHDSEESDFEQLVEYVRVGVIQLSLETIEANKPTEDELYH